MQQDLETDHHPSRVQVPAKNQCGYIIFQEVTLVMAFVFLAVNIA